MKFYDQQRISNLLVVHIADADNVIMIGPALRALRQALPHAKITLLTSSAGSRVTPFLPWLNQVLVCSNNWNRALSAPAGSRTGLIETIRQRNYDAAIILTMPFQSPHPAAYICYLAGIPRRLGQSLEFGGGVLSHEIRISNPTSTVDHHLTLLEAAGFKNAGRYLELSMPAGIQSVADSVWPKAAPGPHQLHPGIGRGPNSIGRELRRPRVREVN